MKRTEIPSRVGVPFADKGTKNTIPVDSQIGVVDGAASFTDGFPPLTMTPVVAGGIPPAGGDFNGILNAITQSVRWACAGGQYQFDSAFSTVIGGYPKGALIQNADGTVLWLNTTDDNTTNPDTGTGWIPTVRYGITTVSLAAANITLTPAQAAKETIVLSGVLTANVQVIFPAWVESWLIVNNCTGSFTVSVKTAAGSGINLGAGTSSQVYGDGTNIYYGALMVKNNLAEIKAAGTNSQSAARSNLGLGSAATHDAQTSKDDVTVGRLLINGGALALRGTLAGPGRAVESFDDLPQNSVSFGYQEATHSPGFTGSVMDYSGTSGGYRVQMCAQYNSSANRIAIRTRNGDSAGTWNSWNELYHTRNKPTATDVDAVSAANGGTFAKPVTFTQGLTSKGHIVHGDYANAVGDSLYNAMLNAYDKNNKLRWAYGPYQNSWSIYCYDATGAYVANLLNIDYTSKNATFAAQVIPGSWTNFDARYYTQSAANAKFVQGIQFGAQASHPVSNNNSFSTAGNSLTGYVCDGSNDDLDTLYSKPVQRNINGTWVTISG